MKIRHSEPYAPLRRQAYPPVGEQLDAVLKLAQALERQGFVLPQETKDWMARCQTVKDRYAKTETPARVPAQHATQQPVWQGHANAR